MREKRKIGIYSETLEGLFFSSLTISYHFHLSWLRVHYFSGERFVHFFSVESRFREVSL